LSAHLRRCMINPMQSNEAGSRQLHELDAAECYRRLRSREVGRLGIVDGDGALVIPVNYAVDGEDFVIRTSPYGMIGLSTPQRAALEIDDIDTKQRLGWSVLVRGTLAIVDADDAHEIRRRTGVTPWPAGSKSMTVRLRPKTVTGRTL
jgi:nitroimidazol reductase NimA-like FMN-containing flavoprotein (pyridoxamine 5'-phosphate oxidase superfamily)